MAELSLVRYAQFTNKLLEDDEDIWFDVYKKICEQNPNFPGCPFPVGMYREVVHGSPAFFEMGGRKVQAPTVEALIAKIVRAYESTKSERWNDDGLRKGTEEGQGSATPG